MSRWLITTLSCVAAAATVVVGAWFLRSCASGDQWRRLEVREFVETPLYQTVCQCSLSGNWALVGSTGEGPVLMDINALQEERIFKTPPLQHQATPMLAALSPDGLYVAFCSPMGPEGNLEYRVAIFAGRYGQATFGVRAVLPVRNCREFGGLSWSPDSSRIAFSADGRIGVVTARGETTPVTWVSGERRAVVSDAPVWLDTHALLFAGDGGIFLTETCLGEVKHICKGRSPVVLDGSAILLARGDAFVKRDLTTGEEAAAFQDHVLGQPVVSPDSRFVAYVTSASVPVGWGVRKEFPRIAIRGTHKWEKVVIPTLTPAEWRLCSWSSHRDYDGPQSSQD